MTDTIGWGILATGGIAATFAQDLSLLPDARVTAVASRRADSARAFADRFGIPNAYDDIDAFAADPDVDIVYVANTHNAHYAAAKRCLEAGKAVLCEKAFTVNHAQAAELVDLARSRGLFLMEAMWMRCNPTILRMTELLADGVIGDVTTLNATFGLGGPFPVEHRLRDPAQAGGSLLDLGVYPVSLAHLVLGPPTSVRASGSLTPEGVDETAAMVFGYDDGAVATLSCSINSDLPVAATIGGPRGHLDLPTPFYRPDRITVNPHGADPSVIELPHQGIGYTHEAVEAMRCLREGRTESPLVPWQSTLDVMATLDEIRAQLGVRYPGE